jgi:hypothetical protein
MNAQSAGQFLSLKTQQNNIKNTNITKNDLLKKYYQFNLLTYKEICDCKLREKKVNPGPGLSISTNQNSQNRLKLSFKNIRKLPSEI